MSILSIFNFNFDNLIVESRKIIFTCQLFISKLAGYIRRVIGELLTVQRFFRVEAIKS